MTQEHQLGYLWGGVALVLAAGGTRIQELAAALPACVVKVSTGLPCPTCGTTRAAGALAKLDLLTALALNPLVAVALVLLVLGGILVGALTLAGVTVREPSWQVSPILRLLMVVAVAANWLYLVWAGV